MSWHFRGPIQLKQFAFYTPGSANTKRSIHPNPLQGNYMHQHLHHDESRHMEDKRGVGDWVTATINGQVVSWVNEYSGPGGAATPAPASSEDDGQRLDPASATPAYSAPSAAASMDAGAGNWGRQAYYNAEQGTANGLVFLNHHGGEGSGVFDE